MTKTHTIAVLEGDGIGPETTAEAIKAIQAVSSRSGVQFDLRYAPFGGQAYFETGASFPLETQKVCDEADAIIKGPIGLSHEESKKIPTQEQPERGALLPLRKRYNTFANFRPVFLPPELIAFSPLKPEVVGDGINIMMIRELVSGLYFGAKENGTDANGLRYVKETLEYNEQQIRDILHVAFKEARSRKKVLHNVHKSNVLISSVLWNTVLDEIAGDYPDVTVKNILVDAAATAMVLHPRQFDVMVMENMFGDILTDLAGGLVGSLGLMPSACVGPSKAYYEPSHGSAPDIAGKGIANPYSMIGSIALMLEKSFGMTEEAGWVWEALRAVFREGCATPDLAKPELGYRALNTSEFGDMVARYIAA
ncbi:MAG TPA: 3-isopropylmalate dehydrogenase [Candidatus Hydrogenedentes bacterium]|jgi:3-isopropylmalate dehydrogenase|nr:3-isopropylmalate dehydrogenase [Candidatus Hydrogenedentota bacterium]HPJ99971.1 3-isopropylmalate dehydrogenase [Candidatus Hydrogenedentota bacterium]